MAWSDECPHGRKTKLVKVPQMGEGWVQRFAVDCRLCGGRPAGLPHKPHPRPYEKEETAASEKEEVPV